MWYTDCVQGRQSFKGDSNLQEELMIFWSCRLRQVAIRRRWPLKSGSELSWKVGGCEVVAWLTGSGG